MNDDLLKALQLIKETCEKHDDCEECPLSTACGDCGVQELAPADWKLQKREVYF